MDYRPIISIKENELQEDCFMYELKQLMIKYRIDSLNSKRGNISIIKDSIQATGIEFNINEETKESSCGCSFTPCFMEEEFKV